MQVFPFTMGKKRHKELSAVFVWHRSIKEKLQCYHVMLDTIFIKNVLQAGWSTMLRVRCAKLRSSKRLSTRPNRTTNSYSQLVMLKFEINNYTLK